MTHKTQRNLRKMGSEMSSTEVWVVPFVGQGHLFPSMELCKHLASVHLKSTLVIPYTLSSSIPSSLRQHSLIEIAELPSPPPPPPPRPGSHPPHHFHPENNSMTASLEKLLSTRPHPNRPIFAVVDIMMGWSGEIFKKSNVPVIGFFTSSASSAAMPYAMQKAQAKDIKPGEVRLLPGLPEEMGITDSDLKERPGGPPHDGKGSPPRPSEWKRRKGAPTPGGLPPWLHETEDFIGLIFNTCHELEGPFLDYMASIQSGKPVWGVGPLLPEQFWSSSGSLVHDNDIRRSSRPSNVTEDEVIEWLDSKPRGSTLYVAFGSEVGPTIEEFQALADALEASNRPFIWVLPPGAGRQGPPHMPSADQPGYFPHGLDEKVGERGLIICGWAPQLLILSHASTGAYISHCGWNSTVEAIGRGVPLLAWPIRGDQYVNAKFVVKYLKVGYMICEDQSQMAKKEDIANGIEKVTEDEDIKRRATMLSHKFEHGFPKSSVASFHAFKAFIDQKVA